MEANELRIGNLVYRVFSPYGQEKDRWIETIERTEKGNDLSLPSSHIKPIPLTDEFLHNLGFRSSRNWDHIYVNDNIDLKINVVNSRFELWNVYGPVSIVKYVHQVQNLVFALTGSELTINHESNQVSVI